MHRALVATACIFILALIAGCGGDDTGTDDTTEADSGLTFTREDGSTFTIADAEVSCGPSPSTDSGEEAIIVGEQEFPDSEPTEPFLLIEGIVADVVPNATIELPDSYLTDDPDGAQMFVYDPGGGLEVDGEETGGNELSSSVGDASGQIVFESASCDPPSVEVSVDATLGSELSDHGTVDVTGSISASGE